MLSLKVILASTRPGRKGAPVADWFMGIAMQRTDYETQLLDLAAINLPFLDEAAHPRFKKYEHQHTRDWSALIEPADAFVLITPEYNFGMPATLKNAFDFLYLEWNYKPVGVVSYGGVAAGTRSTQMLKLVVNSLKMVPMTDNVNIPFIAKRVEAGDKFNSDELLDKSANDMLTELHKWAEALKPMREKK